MGLAWGPIDSRKALGLLLSGCVAEVQQDGEYQKYPYNNLTLLKVQKSTNFHVQDETKPAAAAAHTSAASGDLPQSKHILKKGTCKRVQTYRHG